MGKFTLKDYLIYDESGKPINVKPSLPRWINRSSVELAVLKEWGVYSVPASEDGLPELIGILNEAPAAVKDMYARYIEREKSRTTFSLEEEAESPWFRWNTPPGIIKTVSEPTPEQRKLAKEINAKRAAEKKYVDEIAEAKINLAYSLAAEKATGIKPMSEERKEAATRLNR
ncbi:MAG: hypothetical protein SO401_05845 [Blautia sp.]|nr:hypothetical protein [Blautia sp.]